MTLHRWSWCECARHGRHRRSSCAWRLRIGLVSSRRQEGPGTNSSTTTSWVCAHKLQIRLPEQYHSHPNGPAFHHSYLVPLTRLPQGSQALSHRPSLLDYGAHSANLVSDSMIVWNDMPGDHAGVGLCTMRMASWCGGVAAWWRARARTS